MYLQPLCQTVFPKQSLQRRHNHDIASGLKKIQMRTINMLLNSGVECEPSGGHCSFKVLSNVQVQATSNINCPDPKRTHNFNLMPHWRLWVANLWHKPPDWTYDFSPAQSKHLWSGLGLLRPVFILTLCTKAANRNFDRPAGPLQFRFPSNTRSVHILRGCLLKPCCAHCPAGLSNLNISAKFNWGACIC